MEMKFDYDYIKDDPCYGCRFATKKTEEELNQDGLFSRRFLCMNRNRIDMKEMSAIRAIGVHDYSKALSMVSELIGMTARGCFRLTCEEVPIRPICYQKKESEQ